MYWFDANIIKVVQLPACMQFKHRNQYAHEVDTIPQAYNWTSMVFYGTFPFFHR